MQTVWNSGPCRAIKQAALRAVPRPVRGAWPVPSATRCVAELHRVSSIFTVQFRVQFTDDVKKLAKLLAQGLRLVRRSWRRGAMSLPPHPAARLPAPQLSSEPIYRSLSAGGDGLQPFAHVGPSRPTSGFGYGQLVFADTTFQFDFFELERGRKAVYSAVSPASDWSNALENVRIWPEKAVNSRRRSDTARKEMVFEVEWLFWGMQVSVGGLEGT